MWGEEEGGGEHSYSIKTDISNNMLWKGVSPDDKEKRNVVPIYKRDSKNVIKNYRPTSLLPIFS